MNLNADKRRPGEPAPLGPIRHVADAAAWKRMIDRPGEMVDYAGADGTTQLAVAVPVHLPGDMAWSMVV